MSEMKIGVVSDTHGLLRPELLHALDGVAHILHAGDFGAPDILPQLQEIAPVTAVRGNVDYGLWAERIPQTNVATLGGVNCYLLHNLMDLDLDPAAAGMRVVVYGHTHQPLVEERRGVLYFNPGSAGPRRLNLPVSMGYLHIANGAVRAELRTLDV